MQQITAEMLRDLIGYDPDTGFMVWRARRPEHFRATGGKRSPEGCCANWNARYAGTPALQTLDSNGYRHGHIFNRKVKAHRAAFCLTHGYWPQEVDHINGNRSDNRIANLRAVDPRTNRRNAKLYSNSPTGVPGVTWDNARNCWQARCARKPLGRFHNFDDAVAERRKAEQADGFHPNHGRT